MADWPRIWRKVVPILLIVVVLATTMGMAWHHHARYSADQCMLCHLVIAPGDTSAAAHVFVVEAHEYTTKEVSFVSRCAADQKPPRAPPV